MWAPRRGARCRNVAELTVGAYVLEPYSRADATCSSLRPANDPLITNSSDSAVPSRRSDTAGEIRAGEVSEVKHDVLNCGTCQGRRPEKRSSPGRRCDQHGSPVKPARLPAPISNPKPVMLASNGEVFVNVPEINSHRRRARSMRCRWPRTVCVASETHKGRRFGSGGCEPRKRARIAIDFIDVVLSEKRGEVDLAAKRVHGLHAVFQSALDLLCLFPQRRTSGHGCVAAWAE